ncbi:unnamed protein product, partial [Allacma fusca]
VEVKFGEKIFKFEAENRMACGNIFECDQCLPGCTWVAYEHGICMCLEGLEEATSEVVAIRSGNAGCGGFEGIFCGGKVDTYSTSAKYPQGGYVSI